MFHNEFYFHLIANLIGLFILEQFLLYFCKLKDQRRIHTLKIIFIIINCVIAMLPSFVSYLDSIFVIIIDFIYISYSTQYKFSKKLILLLKYEIFNAIVATTLGVLSLFIFRVFNISSTNELFQNYISLIGLSLFYITFCLYINTKKITSLGIRTKFKKQFNFIFLLSIVALITLSILINSFDLSESKVIPITFTLLLIIVLLQSIYQSLISTLKNEVTQSMLLENERLEKDYYRKVNDSLQSVNTLKHDFKNHIAIINHYAENGENENLCQYLQKISDTIGNDTLVRTPHPIVSTILSVKKQDCIEKGIQFQHSLNFGYLYISDFDITTILGNILDNAITAALKCENPNIFISIQQLDSYLEIDCKNNHMETLKKVNAGFLSTKKDQSILHGIGLKNVDNAVRRLNGRITFTYDSDTFEVTILFPNYES